MCLTSLGILFIKIKGSTMKKFFLSGFILCFLMLTVVVAYSYNPLPKGASSVSSFSATLSSTTPTVLIGATPGVFNNVFGPMVSNSSGVSTTLTIVSGPLTYTMNVPANSGPMPICNDILYQKAVSQAWTATLGAAVTSVYINGQAYQTTP